MKSTIYSTIIILSILAFVLILAAIPTTTTSVSAVVHEGLMAEHQDGYMTHGQDQSAATSTSMLERGDVAMGFNQSKISHQFKSTPT